MKIKYNKEERKGNKERTITAEEEAKRLVALNSSIDTEMFARKETGTLLGAETGQLNIPRHYTLESPYRDWTVSLYPDEKDFSLGFFILHCRTAEIECYIELISLTQELVKITLKQWEIRRFSDAIKEGMKGILRKFTEDFERCIQPLSQEKRELSPILTSKEIKVVRLTRASTSTLTILNRFRWLLPFEMVVGKSTIDEAKETLAVALTTATK